MHINIYISEIDKRLCAELKGLNELLSSVMTDGEINELFNY